MTDTHPAPGRRALAPLAVALVALLGVLMAQSPAAAGPGTPPLGPKWSSRAAAEDNPWNSVAYGNGIYVAVARSGVNRVMTSYDGINWTARSAPADTWFGVGFGGGRFVAVATGSSGQQAMYSTDGINWTRATTPAPPVGLNFDWSNVAYGGGTWVAVRSDNATSNVMVSRDGGATWALKTTPEPNFWYGVAYANGRFVAVAQSSYSATYNTRRVMYSTDAGDNWVVSTGVPVGGWTGVTTDGNGRWVAVGNTGTGNRAMYSDDGGVTWTQVSTGDVDKNWRGVAYANGVYYAVAATGTNPAMYSLDGATWTQATVAPTVKWTAVAATGTQVVAVGSPTRGERVMTSNTAYLNQVKDAAGNLTNTMQVVPPSGTDTIQRIDIIYNTQARIDASPPPPALGARWGIWGMNWGDTTLTLANSNVIPVNLATYQNAGSCVGLGSMKATDCPRPTPMGPVKPGQSQVFRANIQIGGTWIGTPNTTITRPPAG